MDLGGWLDVASGRFVTGLLIFARFGGLLFAAPLVGGKNVPNPVRIGLSGALALILTPLAAPNPGMSMPVLVVGLFKEVALGLALGWTASLLFASVQMAGEWLDLQAGFQTAQVLNPAFDTQNALLGNFKYLLAGLVFLGSGGYAIML